GQVDDDVTHGALLLRLGLGALGGLGLGLGLGLGGPQRLGGLLALGRALDAGDGQQLGHRLGRLGTLGQPGRRLLGVDLDLGGLVVGVVDAEVLEEAPVARAARVGDDDAVEGGLLGAHAH